VAVLAIERTATGHAIAELRRGARLAPRILDRGTDAVRAAFVPTQAGPLAGDRDSTRIVVGSDATLIVEPVAATLALPGAPRTVLRLDATVRAGGRLVLDEGPLIVAAGADVERRCTIELETGAVAALRETVVLGRDGEPPGTLDSSLRVTLDGCALLHDGLRFSAAAESDDAHVALAPGHRVVVTACLLGVRPAPSPGVMTLEGPGGLRRVSGTSLAGIDAAVDEQWRTWSNVR
jgi:urease accessory protein